MGELKRKAAQNSGEAEYIEKVVYNVKQTADDVKKVSDFRAKSINRQLVFHFAFLDINKIQTPQWPVLTQVFRDTGKIMNYEAQL